MSKKYICSGPNGARSSTIESVKNIERNGVMHAGQVAHTCDIESEEAHENQTAGDVILKICKCQCGIRWVRNFK